MKTIVITIGMVLCTSCMHTNRHPKDCDCDDCNLAPLELLYGSNGKNLGSVPPHC